MNILLHIRFGLPRKVDYRCDSLPDGSELVVKTVVFTLTDIGNYRCFYQCECKRATIESFEWKDRQMIPENIIRQMEDHIQLDHIK